MTLARPMFPPRAEKSPQLEDSENPNKISVSQVRKLYEPEKSGKVCHSSPSPETATALQAAQQPVYVRTDISPADLFKALGDARNEAAAAIEQLIAILDLIDGNCDFEPSGDELDADADSEPSLAAPENHPEPPVVPSFYRKRVLRHSDQSGEQTHWGDQGNLDDREGGPDHDDREGDELEHGGCGERDDYELSGDETEPSLGSFDRLTNQEHGWRQTAGNSQTWAMHGNGDFEKDAAQ